MLYHSIKFTKNTYKKFIHNQSYIVLNNEYNNLLTKIKESNCQASHIIDNLNKENILLKQENKNLNQKVIKLENELLEKNKFYNLNYHKFN